MKTVQKKIQLKRMTLVISIISLFIFGLGGCKKFVEVPAPNTQLVTASVFNNAATATSAQLYIYVQMGIMGNYDGYAMENSLGLYADEFTNYDVSDNTQIQLYSNSLKALNNPGPWIDAYQYIYDANAVISGLQTTSGCSPAVKQQLTGEALFVRAFWHFNLTNIYGDVPIVLTTNYTTNKSIARSARKQVLQQVIADLQQAKNMLNANYIDASDTATP